jgi:hypothetical protein
MNRRPYSPPSLRIVKGPTLMRTMAALLRKTAGYKEALAAIRDGDPSDPKALAARALKLHDEPLVRELAERSSGG